MIKKLEVDNFKTLNHFELELTPMTVIVGNNASGKSSILQVISLLCSSAQEDYDAFLFCRNWNVSDLRSKCNIYYFDLKLSEKILSMMMSWVMNSLKC